ncbi:hypothetical protein [Tsukamurella paurometabola]
MHATQHEVKEGTWPQTVVDGIGFPGAAEALGPAGLTAYLLDRPAALTPHRGRHHPGRRRPGLHPTTTAKAMREALPAEAARANSPETSGR